MDGTRTCDGCALCCKLPMIPQLQKPWGVWCDKCSISSGCSIYETRPEVCRDFACLWLQHPGMPDAARPDRSRAIVVYRTHALHGRVVMVFVERNDFDRVHKPVMKKVLKQIRANGMKLFVHDGTTKKELTKAGELVPATF